MRIALLPTGVTEWGGLPAAFQQLFPAHDFYAIPSMGEIQSSPDRFPLNGFTSNPLRREQEQQPPETARELVERAAQEALGDRDREAADVVIVLDDLELANAGQPDVVTRVFRKATELHLQELQARHDRTARFLDRTAQALKERVSFHLIVPMIEAWLFADRAALAVAGVLDTSQALAAPDLEDFSTNDAAYLAATDADCPAWASKRSKKHRPKWLGPSPRARHPKGYLQWLCRKGTEPNCTTYDESTSGCNAVKGLRWHDVLARPGSPSRYLRALLADLSDALGEPPATISIEEDPASPIPSTRLTARPADHVLRNL